MNTRKLYDISFSRGDRLTTWQRWATDAQEARTSATKALEQEYPAEDVKIVAIAKAGHENDFDIWLDDIVRASFGTLAAIGRGKIGWRAFTWDNDDFEPLVIDAFTASAMVQVYDALSGANQAKFRRMIGVSRGSFARLLEFTWKQVA